jgi:hypothetical protein
MNIYIFTAKDSQCVILAYTREVAISLLEDSGIEYIPEYFEVEIISQCLSSTWYEKILVKNTFLARKGMKDFGQ